MPKISLAAVRPRVLFARRNLQRISERPYHLSAGGACDCGRAIRVAIAGSSGRTGVLCPTEADDALTLSLLCCHPSLTLPSQVALTLRAVGGLNTAEIARAFLVPETTIAQRISRANQRIKAAGARFEMPPAAERAARLDAVLRVLYLIFNEGHTASAGSVLYRRDLTTEAMRLIRQVRDQLPDDGEVAGLLALMLQTDARKVARVDKDGSLVPLAQQDRTPWDRDAISEGVRLIQDALARTPIGPYQVQAAIAAVHSEALSAETTDWPQILGLYNVLRRLAAGPMVTLNRIVAVAMVDGGEAALENCASQRLTPRLPTRVRDQTRIGHCPRLWRRRRLQRHARFARNLASAAQPSAVPAFGDHKRRGRCPRLGRLPGGGRLF